MHLSTIALTLAVATSLVAADCTQLGGNTYCNSVEAVAFENVGFSGSYNEVTSMADCSCQMQPASFSGALAPMNQDISLHFRGPVQIKQVAVYSADSSSSTAGAKIKKRDGHHVHANEKAKRAPHVHDQQHAVRHDKRALDIVTEVVTVYETVYYNPDGAVTSTLVNTAAAAPTDTTGSDATQVIADNIVTASVVTAAPASTDSSSSSSDSAAPAPASTDSSSPSSSDSAAPAPVSTDSSSPSSSDSAAPATTFVVSTTSAATGSSSAAFSSSSSSSAPSASSSSSSWSRFAYYNSEQGSSNGLTFLNNMGGTNGSGTWDSCWGNSLSYSNTDGVTGASESTILGDVLLPSDAEVIIFTDTQCSGSSCGYYREGIPAYVGFTGDMKLFLLEFGMPTDSTSSSGTGNLDMPAVWFLNGKIPRTQQYGSCSCWESGCGEFDVFEVLSSGSQYMVPTLHDWQGTNNQYGGGGSSDYFVRPTTGTMKAAVLFDGSSMSISLLQLDPSTEFGDSVSADTISQWLASNSNGATVRIAS
ncbi:putative TOS1-like glycosyl hydrolase-domain-containing protein [Lipomyces kononenkoae]|uniref:TOS1-like glycosyl hydrolase-domain-containing protein n=1 Tax=Lipomyces kononenkoae TaxID=34357 RepID=A0ACC3STY6_LIPKO